MEINKEYVQKLAHSLYFDLNDQQIDLFINQIMELNKTIAQIEQLNLTDQIPPTNYCPLITAQLLRDDQFHPQNQPNPQDVLANTKLDQEGYVVIKNEK